MNEGNTVKKTDNGDGTVTFHGIDVTVLADVLRGRDVLAVRPPKYGEPFINTTTLDVDMAIRHFDACNVRIILGPKPEPVFREGGFYLDVAQSVRGPLRKINWTEDHWGWFDQDNRQYTPEGKGKSGVADLLPGEVIVWQPPMSLPADDWDWQNGVLSCNNRRGVLGDDLARGMYSDWVTPPKSGLYRVPGGGKLAMLITKGK